MIGSTLAVCVVASQSRLRRPADIGVRANIHLGGQTEFCPNGFSGGGVVAEIFRDPSSVGGGVVAEIFRDPYSVGWQDFFR